jgi:DNA polymerase-3 subunit delta'
VAFASVIGHDRLKDLLSRALREARLPPALLFAGPEGVGKRTLALAVGRALVCERRGGDACDGCASCSRALRGLHPDLRTIEPETSAIKIEQIRDLVREVAGRPFEGSARAFVLDDAHALTEQAANALLKSLEEPPPTSHLFLVTAAPQGLLPTIRSRCQTLRFSPLPEGLLEAHLKERLGLSAEEARLRAILSQGSLGSALAFESEAYRALRDELLALLEGLEGWGPVERMEAAERLEEKDEPDLALGTLRSLLRDLAALRAGAPPRVLLNADAVARLAPLSQGKLGERAALLAEAVGETRTALRGNANKLLAMDELLETLAGPAMAAP